MRNRLFICLLALPMLIALGSFSTATSRRHPSIPPARQDLYCLQGRSWGYPGSCEFSTYDQCMATASGTFSLLWDQSDLCIPAARRAVALIRDPRSRSKRQSSRI